MNQRHLHCLSHCYPIDTTDERNGLIEHVYPRLREYCLSKYNLQFQVSTNCFSQHRSSMSALFVALKYSDMRWGIQSSASNTHSTVDMCLQELDTCCRLSLATNCVVSQQFIYSFSRRREYFFVSPRRSFLAIGTAVDSSPLVYRTISSNGCPIVFHHRSTMTIEPSSIRCTN